MRFGKTYRMKDIEDYWFPIENIKDRIEKVDIFFRDIKVGIKNLIEWLPVIWKDRWWDHTFLYEMLRFKLSIMERKIRKHGIHLNAHDDADQIKLCVSLLDRLIDDDYHENAFKNHDKKWGEGVINWAPVEGTDLLSMDCSRPNVNTPEEKKKEGKEWKVCMDHIEPMIKQDLETLFNTMRKHIRHWWD